LHLRKSTMAIFPGINDNMVSDPADFKEGAMDPSLFHFSSGA
jgi:hypothetical protein